MFEETNHNEFSLEQLENDYWGEPPPDATTLMAKVYALRRRPIGSLEVEDLRILIGQQEGLGVLVPRALSLLKEDPLVEGDFFPGDLLLAVLRVPTTYWATNPTQAATLSNIIGSVKPDNDLIIATMVNFRRSYSSARSLDIENT